GVENVTRKFTGERDRWKANRLVSSRDGDFTQRDTLVCRLRQRFALEAAAEENGDDGEGADREAPQMPLRAPHAALAANARSIHRSCQRLRLIAAHSRCE